MLTKLPNDSDYFKEIVDFIEVVKFQAARI